MYTVPNIEKCATYVGSKHLNSEKDNISHYYRIFVL